MELNSLVHVFDKLDDVCERGGHTMPPRAFRDGHSCTVSAGAPRLSERLGFIDTTKVCSATPLRAKTYTRTESPKCTTHPGSTLASTSDPSAGRMVSYTREA